MANRPTKLVVPVMLAVLATPAFAAPDTVFFPSADGSTEIAYTDFAYIAQRYGISGKDAQLKMASEVAATVAGEAAE